jgi:hypothetical protein
LGIISAITDLKNKKIYNKNIALAVIISFFSYLVLYKEIEIIYIYNFLINLIISIIISFLFFNFKIWAAGDAKLFLSIIFMIPYEVYEVETTNVFPAIYLLIMIFNVAFIYVIFETIYLWIKDKEKFKKIKELKFKKSELKVFLIKYFMGYFVILFINNITSNFFTEIRISNSGLILICNMLILLFIYRIIRENKQSLIVALIFALANIIYYVIFGLEIYHINIKMFIIVLIIMLFRSVSEKYNYKKIKIEDLKPRMILSFNSILKFYTSTVKGLPRSTTETTDSRLNEEEVESIKRWSKTKKGEETIIIVRHMPFAPFMLLGEILFFILKLYS